MSIKPETLNKDSTIEHVAAAMDFVAGLPMQMHAGYLADINDRTGRDLPTLRLHLMKAIEKLECTKHHRLRLKNLLLARGVVGRDRSDEDQLEDGDHPLILPDPFDPYREIAVRNAVLIGARPIVQRLGQGPTRSIDEYVARLVLPDDDLGSFTITRDEIVKQLSALEDHDAVQLIPVRKLCRGNIQAFDSVIAELLRMRKLLRQQIAKLKDDDASGSAVKQRELELKEFDEQLDSVSVMREVLELNRRFAFVREGKNMVIEHATQKRFLRNEIASYLEPVKANGKKIYPIWAASPVRAQFDELVFAPNGCDVHGRPRNLDRACNLWIGFAVKGKRGDWSKLRHHIVDVLCDGDEVAAAYVIKWMAHLFQRPWDKPGVALVFWGEKRTGKGTFSDALRTAVGRAMARMFNYKEHIVGRFYPADVPLMLIVAEEALFAKDPREAGVLKSRITDPSDTVEWKGQTIVEFESFTRYIFNSNLDTPVPITFDEGRYMVCKVSSNRAQDHAYFEEIRQQLYHQGGLEAMVHDLMHMDIDDFNVRQPPRTAAWSDMVSAMLDKDEMAIAELLRTGELVIHDAEDGFVCKSRLNEKVVTSVAKSLVREVLNEAFARYGSRTATEGDITKKLNDLGLLEGMRNRDVRRGIEEAQYVFKPLEEARQSFAEKRKIPVAILKGQCTPEAQDPLAEMGNHLEALRQVIHNQADWEEKYEKLNDLVIEMSREVRREEASTARAHQVATVSSEQVMH